MIGLIALFLGTIVRNSAAGISAILGLIFVAPIVLQLFALATRAPWVQNVFEFLPSSAGSRLFGYSRPPGPSIPDVIVLDPANALLVLIAWVALFAAIATTLLKSRDA